MGKGKKGHDPHARFGDIVQTVEDWPLLFRISFAWWLVLDGVLVAIEDACSRLHLS